MRRKQMNSKKVFFIMLGVVIFLLTACIGVIYTGDKMLQARAAKLQELKLEEAELEQKKNLLTQAQLDVEKYGYISDIAKSVVPQDKDQARAVREINQIAALSDVTLNSITFPNSTLGEKKKATPAPETPAADGATPAPAPPAISQAVPVTGISGVYSLEMDITSGQDIPYYNMLQFLSRLEKNRRTAQVTEVRVTPVDPGVSSRVSFTLKLKIFIKPGAQD